MKAALPGDICIQCSLSKTFLVKDIMAFAMPEQLDILGRAKTWYMDATFKVVKKPFTQLFTVHCFVKKDEHIKQVPVLYALMSGKKTSDYKAVLKALKAALPGNIRVQEGMLDFEKALWTAMASVFPQVSV